MKRRLIIVAGASRGIGSAIARGMSDRGFLVVGLARSYGGNSGPTYVEIKCDVSDEVSVSRAFSEIGRLSFERVDLVNCAGVGQFGKIEEMSSESFLQMLKINTLGAFHLVRGVLPLMRRLGGGRIIHIGSLADHIGFPDCSGYASSKFGLRGFCEVSNSELAKDGVFTTLLSLGAVWTDIWKSRKGFQESDMLNVQDVCTCVESILAYPEKMRVDNIRLTPPKGVL